MFIQSNITTLSSKYSYIPGQEGLFRNGKLSPLPIFRCPEAAEWMKPALAVRETVNQLVGAGSTKIWHVDIVANPQDYDVLQVSFYKLSSYVPEVNVHLFFRNFKLRKLRSIPTCAKYCKFRA